MSAPGQLQQLQHNNNNMMNIQENNTRGDDERTTVSDIRKESLEILVIRTIQRVIGPIMEDLVRKVVKEQIELVQEDIMHRIQCNLRQGNTSEPRCLRLMLSPNVNSPVLTSSKIKGEGGNSIKLTLVDSLTGEVVKSGPEAGAEVKILVLKGDYAGHEVCNEDLEDFNNRIVNEMEGKKSVLQGTTILRLKEGISSIDDLSFTQNARWMRKSKWCLGARAVNSFPGTTIEPAKTESFDLKDKRTKSYAKKVIPSLSDKVLRLKHIGKGVTKRLNDEKIYTVKDFLVLLNTNQQRLYQILDVGSKRWEEVTDHAKKCVIDGEVYTYTDPNSQQKCGVVFDVIGQVKGLIKEFQYFPMHVLPDDEQKDAQKLVVCAFERREKVSTYPDLNSLMECFPQTLGSTMTENLSQFNSWDRSLFKTCEQAGIPSNNICTSINCIGESSQLDSLEQGLCGPIYSPPFLDEEILNFLNSYNQPERRSLELKPKLSWFIICVSRWFMIRKRVGTSERDRANKKQKIT